jgi:hypothetical protein
MFEKSVYESGRLCACKQFGILYSGFFGVKAIRLLADFCSLHM